jgi:hypothetical protein
MIFIRILVLLFAFTNNIRHELKIINIYVFFVNTLIFLSFRPNLRNIQNIYIN